MKEVINGKLYDTETATLLASDHYWDGSNWERQGRNTFLYKSPRGAFFLHKTTIWQGERDSMEVISEAHAMREWESLPEKEEDYTASFGIEPEEG